MDLSLSPEDNALIPNQKYTGRISRRRRRALMFILSRYQTKSIQEEYCRGQLRALMHYSLQLEPKVYRKNIAAANCAR